MKEILFLSAMCFGLVTTSHAQTKLAALKSEIKMDKTMGESGKSDKRIARKELRKLEGNEVSYNSIQAFEKTFSHIKPSSSERLDNFDEFNFIENGKKISAFFDADFNLVGTTQIKSFTDLPAKSRALIAEKYKGFSPSNVLYLDNNELNSTHMILYNYEFEPADSYFVEMSNGFKTIVLQVKKDGKVNYFTRIF